MYSDKSKVTFIPKAPVTTIQTPTSISGVAAPETYDDTKHGLGFIGWLCLLLLIATIVSAVGSILYLRYHQAQQAAIIESIKKQQTLVDTNFIANLQKLSTRITYTKNLLDQQVYMTPLFEALHANTLKDVQFDSFEFKKVDRSALGDSGAPVSNSQYQAVLGGRARSYEAIAQQSDVFGLDPVLKTHFFSDFKIEKEKSLISFVLTIDLPDKLGHDRFTAVEAQQDTDGFPNDAGFVPGVESTAVPQSQLSEPVTPQS